MIVKAIMKLPKIDLSSLSRYLSWRLLIASVLTAFFMSTAWAEPPRGLITISFDDGSRSQHDHGLRLASKYGLVGTIFIPAGLIKNDSATSPDSWLISWEDVRDFVAAGWEIGAHGHTHTRLPDLDPGVLEQELQQAITSIEIETGTRPVSFSSPFGAFTDSTIKRIMNYYDYHLSWKGHGGRNPVDAIDPTYIGRYEVTSDIASDELCKEMVRAAEERTWLVLLFHGLTDGTPPGNYELSVKAYEDVLSCAVTLRDAGVIDVVTVREAMTTLLEGMPGRD